MGVNFILQLQNKLRELMDKLNLKKILIYSIAFFSGGIILILEILGTRILAPFYGSTIYVWTAIITITLLFLSIGYFFGGFVSDKFYNRDLLSFILFFSAFFIFIIPFIKIYVLFLSEKAGYITGVFFSSFLILSTPMILLGSITPYCLKLSTDNISSIGITAGKLYGISTLGSLTGAIIAVFFLIPNLDIKLIFTFLGFLLFLFSILWNLINKQRKKIFLFICYLVILIFIIYFLPSLNYYKRTTIKYDKNTVYSNVRIIEQNNYRSLLLDGALQGDYDMKTKKFMGDYIKLMADSVKYIKNPKDALVLGLGCGALKTELDKEGINSIFVEIDPVIKKIAENYFNFKGEVVINDARHFLKYTKKSFDLIFIDVYNSFNFCPYLFSKEAILEMKKILNPGGLVVINTIGNVKKDKKSSVSFDKHILAINETLKTIFNYVKLKATNENMANIVFYAADIEFKISNYFIDVNIDNKGIILTDDFNPLEYFSKEIVKKWWSDQIKMLGKDALL